MCKYTWKEDVLVVYWIVGLSVLWVEWYLQSLRCLFYSFIIERQMNGLEKPTTFDILPLLSLTINQNHPRMNDFNYSYSSYVFWCQNEKRERFIKLVYKYSKLYNSLIYKMYMFWKCIAFRYIFNKVFAVGIFSKGYGLSFCCGFFKVFCFHSSSIVFFEG